MNDIAIMNAAEQASVSAPDYWGIPEFVRDLFDRLFSTSPTKEHVLLGAVGVGGAVALCAIRHGYDFEYDHQNKKVSVKRNR